MQRSTNSREPLLLDRRVPFVDAVLRLLDGHGSSSEAVQILKAAENECHIELSTVQPFPAPKRLPDELYAEYIENRFFRFLSITHLILGSVGGSRLSILFPENYLYDMGLREWGHVISRWASRENWLGRSEWSFADFTAGPSDKIIFNYNSWSSTTMSVLREKSTDRITSLTNALPELIQLLKSADVRTRQDVVTTIGGLGKAGRSILETSLAHETDKSVSGIIEYYISVLKAED